MTNNNIKEFLNYLKDIIVSMEAEIAEKIRDSKTQAEIDSCVKELAENPYSIADISNVYISNLLNKYDKNHLLISENEIDFFFEKLDVLRSLAFGRKEGIGFTYTEKELRIIKKLIDLLSELKNNLIEEENRQIKSRLPKKAIDYKFLYEKLLKGTSGTEYFDQEEIEKIIALFKDKDFDYRLTILKYIYYLNNVIGTNRISNTNSQQKK